MGGADKVLALAQAAHDQDEDRWAATLLDHLVFADPANVPAKELLARVYEQLGYRAESAPWRDVYLTGRWSCDRASRAPWPIPPGGRPAAQHARRAVLDSMTVRVDGPAADGKRFKFNFVFTDVGETHVLELGNGVLYHRRAEPAADADATVRLTRDLLLRLGTGEAAPRTSSCPTNWRWRAAA